MKPIHTHYDNLKVARDAPSEVVRAAYKTLSQKYHPDRNPDNADAARIMAYLNEAYAVLSDPKRRKEHDEWIAREERSDPEAFQAKTESSRAPSPTYKPSRNFAIAFFRSTLRVVKGLAIWAFSYAAAIGIFIGAIWLIGIGVTSLEGKSAPPSAPKPYQSIPPQPMKTSGTSENWWDDPSLYQSTPPEPTETSVRPESSGGALRNDNAGHPIDLYRCKVNGVVHFSNRKISGATCVSLWSYSKRNNEIAQSTATPGFTKNSSHLAVYINAPNGKPWPKGAGYVSGFPRLATRGLSTVTVDNTQNDTDVFVKLVSLDGAVAMPVRFFYIPAFKKFAVHKIDAGNYDVRYRDLNTGHLSRSEQFALEETELSEGTQYSQMSLTLYKVQNGNMQTYDLAENEF